MVNLKNLRQIGTTASFLSTFFFFCYAVARAFNILDIRNDLLLDRVIFITLCIILGTGFTSLFIGSTLQQKIDRKEYAKIAPKEKIRNLEINNGDLSEEDHLKIHGDNHVESSIHDLPIPEKILTDLEDAKKSGVNINFYIQQQEYLAVRSGGQGQTKPIFFFTIILGFINLFLYAIDEAVLMGVIPPTGILQLIASYWDSIYIYTFCFGTISVAFLIAFVAGNVTEDFMRNYMKGFHVHESVVGIYFILIGIPIMATVEFYNIRFSLGNSFLIAGIFLIGRDWKDIVKGNILVHQSKESDYEQYLKLSAYAKTKEEEKARKHKFPLLINKIKDIREKKQDQSK